MGRPFASGVLLRTGDPPHWFQSAAGAAVMVRASSSEASTLTRPMAGLSQRERRGRKHSLSLWERAGVRVPVA
jgi:hypothetical protein